MLPAEGAERQVSFLSEQEEVDQDVIRYLNCLSDYLFVLSRHLAKQLGVAEIA